MAKSKSRSSSTAVEKKSVNQNVLMQQYYAVRAEIRKVTWPTREEARQLTIAVTVGTVVIALFLFSVDLLFDGIIAGLVNNNVAWMITGVVVLLLLAAAFYTNNREV